MSDLKRGDVILVRFPFTDLRTTKLRPAAVLSLHGEDLIVAGIFSAPPQTLKETWLLIEEKSPPFAQTGLKRSSVIKGEKIAILHRSVVYSAIGSLSPVLMAELSKRIRAALQLD